MIQIVSGLRLPNIATEIVKVLHHLADFLQDWDTSPKVATVSKCFHSCKGSESDFLSDILRVRANKRTREQKDLGLDTRPPFRESDFRIFSRFSQPNLPIATNLTTVRAEIATSLYADVCYHSPGSNEFSKNDLERLKKPCW